MHLSRVNLGNIFQQASEIRGMSQQLIESRIAEGTLPIGIWRDIFLVCTTAQQLIQDLDLQLSELLGKPSTKPYNINSWLGKTTFPSSLAQRKWKLSASWKYALKTCSNRVLQKKIGLHLNCALWK